MTRVCSRCHAFLGHKCPECGGEAKFRRVRRDNRVLAICANSKCAVKEFPIGESGATHTLCAACSAAMYPELPRKQVGGAA